MHLLLRLLAPKTRLGWLLFWVFVFMFSVAIGPQLLRPKGLLLLATVAVPLVGAARLISPRWLFRWERLHYRLRGALVASFAYVLVVSLGHYSEIYNFRLWLEFLLPLRASPWTSIHSVGAVAFGCFYSSQFYFLNVNPPADHEQVRSGQPLISHADAQRRSDELFRR